MPRVSISCPRTTVVEPAPAVEVVILTLVSCSVATSDSVASPLMMFIWKSTFSGSSAINPAARAVSTPPLI